MIGETFGQFCANLNALRRSDAPEVAHQARVAWRRFKSACSLFKPLLNKAEMPDRQALVPLLTFLGELRDIDVLLGETLPPLRDDYVAHDSTRAKIWSATLQALYRAGAIQRSAVRYALEDPAVGVCLLQTTLWLEQMSVRRSSVEGKTDRLRQSPLRPWAKRRVTRQHTRMKQASQLANDAVSLHKLRILAKRTRYGIEALRGVLPSHLARKWHREAVNMQRRIGIDRDIELAIVLLGQIEAAAEIVALLRGFAAGRRSA